MPGHKGMSILGFENADITEISGADSLYEASGIIKESEQNASLLFGSDTYYSTEGSSQCIRAMLYLATLYAKENNKSNLILAGRNAHKTFVSAAALLDTQIVWIEGDTADSYLSCSISADYLDSLIESRKDSPMAVYLTNPDYLGNMVDIKALSQVCKKHNILLLIDNAHGAYLKFLTHSEHPIDMGADMCCDSAHKTLPVLTGGAYLHISTELSGSISPFVKDALALFGSTSPSYLILESLDCANKYIYEGYKDKLRDFIEKTEKIKTNLAKNGYSLCSQEKLKITIRTKDYGYTGTDFADILLDNNIVCEFSDPDFAVLMLSVETDNKALERLEKVLLDIPRLAPIKTVPPELILPKSAMSVREATLSPKEIISTDSAKGRILAATTVGCPPAVPFIVCGEIINENTMEFFRYYNIKNCVVVK